VRPSLPGIDSDGVFQLHTIGDSLILHEALAREPDRALIVGAGYIGLELAEALRRRGTEVVVVEQLPTVLPTVDPELGEIVRPTVLPTVDPELEEIVRAELERNGVEVINGATVARIERDGGRLAVSGTRSLRIEADIVLVVVGVRPDVELAQVAGVELGERGALQVSRRMQTNLPEVFAAGDCVVTYHRLLGRDAYIPLGTTAHKQGRVAGENAVGGERTFQGSLGTQVVKVFDLAAARTGLRDGDAQAAGYEPHTVATRAYDHKAYYPDPHEIAIRTTGDSVTGRLLGMQLVGHLDAEVPKRVDIAAAALFHGITIALNDLDLSYAPPFGSPWDAVQSAAQAWPR
jgi:NADPH-dependent 2,4-dienoyl-CoA reductase/sulfur reductase-like enzyme